MNKEKKLITSNEHVENNNIVPIFETRTLSENRNSFSNRLRRMRRINNERNNTQSEISESNMLTNNIDSNLNNNTNLTEPLLPENIEVEENSTQLNSEPLVDTTNITETHRVIPINSNINRINFIDVGQFDADSTARSNSMRIIRAQVENQTDSAINYIELAQNQNRWVLFGLGIAFILVAGVSYFLGYRRGLPIGRDNLTTILPNNRLDLHINQDSILSTNDEHKKSVFKVIWNILIDTFKFKK